MKEINFNDKKLNLTENDIDQIVSILGKKCRINTIRRLRSILTYSPSMIKSYGILNRLILEDNQWRYIAGQDYVSEVKTVRQLILE